MSCFEEKIDYDAVETALEKEREKSLGFLLRALDIPTSQKEKVATTLLVKPMDAPAEIRKLQQRVNELEKKLLDMTLLENSFRILRKYYWYKLLSKVTSGQRRKHYVAKRSLWKERVRRLQAVKKRMKRLP